MLVFVPRQWAEPEERRCCARTGIDTVEVIQIRREAEPLDGAFDVLVDVFCRVGKASTSVEHVVAALGSHFVVSVTPCLPARS